MNLFRVMTLFVASLLFGNANEVDSDSEPVQSAVPDETPSPARADDPETSKPAAELARLRKIWDDWKLKATSMEVEGFEFYGRADDNQLSHKDLIKLIQEDLPKLVNQNQKYDVAALEAVTGANFPRPTKENVNSATFGRWADISLVRDANNLKFVQTIDGRTSSTVRRGAIEQTYSIGNRQASVYTKNGHLNIPGIDMFLYGPALPLRTPPWRLQGTDPVKMHLIAEGDQGAANLLDYDAVSGFVGYHGLRVSDTRFIKEHFQSGAVLTKDGVPLPRIVADINYTSRPESTRRVTIYVLTAVEIGNEIDRAEFNLGVPAGTNVVLFEGAPGDHPKGLRPAMAFTKRAVDDAAEFAHSEEFQNAQRK